MSILSGSNYIVFFLMFLLFITWCVISTKRPLIAYLCTFFVFIIAYQRLIVGFVNVSGPGNRGAIYLGDLLWFGLIVGFLVFSLKKIVISKTSFSFPLSVWGMFPYIILAVLLPICGLVWGWPLSYAFPSIRQIQWVSFGVIAYYLASYYGISKVLYNLFNIIVISGIIHMSYAIIQFGYYHGVLGREWIILDNIYLSQNVNSWFYYPRLTGLLVNPNSFGLLGAFIFILAIVFYICRVGSFKWFWLLPLITSIFTLIFASSRSALIGLIIGILLISFTLFSRAKYLARGFKLAGLLIGISVIIGLFVWPFLPDVMWHRILYIVQAFTVGLNVDPNFSARVDMWTNLIRIFWQYYPLGTWVPPNYATESPIDSYYVTTFLQGTIIYTFCFIMFLLSVFCQSCRLIWTTNREASIIGLVLLGWTGIILGGSISLSPLMEPHLNALYWSLLGLGIFALKKYHNKGYKSIQCSSQIEGNPSFNVKLKGKMNV